MSIKTFSDVLRQAIADFEAHGFDSEERLEKWQRELLKAAEGHTAITADNLKRTLTSIYTAQVTKGGLLRLHNIPAWKLNQIVPKLQQELQRRIMASAQLIKLNREEMIAKTMRRFSGWATSVPIGGSDSVDKKEENASIKKALKSLPYEERRVMIDQAGKFKASLSNITATETGAIAAMWKSHYRAAGYNARPDHAERDGEILVIRDNWALKGGLMKLGGHQYTDEIEMPAEFVYCFPEDSKVPFADNVEKAFRHFYNGKLTEVITDSGKTLRATPNHPVLTDGGWKPAGSLNEGDYIIEIANELLPSLKGYEDERVTTIAQIFSTLNKGGVLESADGCPDDFHGDGSYGNVDIVFAARLLTFSQIAGLTKNIDNLHFTKAYLSSLARHFKMPFVRVFASACSIMRSLGNLLSVLFRSLRHAQKISFFASSDNAASKCYASSDSITTDVVFGGDRLDGLPGGMKLRKCRVNSIRKVEFNGHVYNLQTGYHWYSAGGIIVHNCQCRYKYLYNLRDLPDEMLTEKGRASISRK